MDIWNERKIDCHNHILDPIRFPYQAGVAYRPSGQEIAPYEQLMLVMDSYGVQHSLVVGPNSGYGTDNRCLLDALTRAGGRLRGIAVVPHDISLDGLASLQAQGVAGVAFNLAVWGAAYYQDTGSLLEKLEALGMLLQLQSEGDRLLALLPLLRSSKVWLLIDHCGRPDVARGVAGAAFQAVLALGRDGRAWVKLSGYDKFSRLPHPYADTVPFVRALVDAFTLDRCMWGSDWPYLKAAQRVDYGPLLRLAATLFPDPADRARLFWDTPNRLFGFGGA